MAKHIYQLRIEYFPIGAQIRRRRMTRQIETTPREALRQAAKAVRDGRGAVDSAVIIDGLIPVVRCQYSIRGQKPTRRVERSWARCSIDPIFKRQLKEH